jgi:hypothetical protein
LIFFTTLSLPIVWLGLSSRSFSNASI